MYLLMAIRLMYYWTLLNKDDSELAKKVLETQQLLSSKNDWVLQLQNDLKECRIELSEAEIKRMKKEQFKSLVKKRIKTLSMEYLIGLRSKLSKSENLLHQNCMKDYLKSDKITLEEKKLLFAMKTRAINVKTNFRNNFSNTNMLCRLCHKPGEKESELHLMKCETIISCDNNIGNLLTNISYMDIFGTIEKQVIAIKVWKKVLKIWEVKLEVSRASSSGHQVHQPVGQSASYAHNASSAQTVDVDVDSTPSDGRISNVYDFG